MFVSSKIILICLTVFTLGNVNIWKQNKVLREGLEMIKKEILLGFDIGLPTLFHVTISNSI